MKRPNHVLLHQSDLDLRPTKSIPIYPRVQVDTINSTVAAAYNKSSQLFFWIPCFYRLQRLRNKDFREPYVFPENPQVLGGCFQMLGF